MKTLLAIINKPDNSKAFINYALSLAENLNYGVQFLYMTNSESYIMSSPGAAGMASVHMQKTLEIRVDDAQRTIEESVAEVIRERSGNINTSITARIGAMQMYVKELVDNNKVHMVLLESDENESLWNLTSSSKDIVEHMNCPVWVVPHKAVFNNLKKIVYATDYKEEDLKNIKQLVKMTGKFSPFITALHVTDSIDFQEKVKKTGFNELMQNRIGYPNLMVNVIPESATGENIDLITDYAETEKADLIVVLKEDRGFFESLFSSSDANKLIEQSDIPVLVYHED